MEGGMRQMDMEAWMARQALALRRSPQILTAMIELTYGCNLRCVHCYNPTHQARGELTTEEVFRILDQLGKEGCVKVGFTGGEIFTRKDAAEIIRYARKLGLLVSLLTNATLITPKIADQICRMGPYDVGISVYGGTSETYERVTQVRGSFEKFVHGVDLLCEREVPVFLKLVLMTLNVHELELMKAFALRRGLRYQFSTHIHPKVDGSKEPLAYRLPSDQAFAIWRKEQGEPWAGSKHGAGWMANGEEEGCGLGRDLFPCGCGKTMAAITPHGRLNLCLSIYEPRYDLTQGSLKEGWKELVKMVAGSHPGPEFECPECPLTRYCTRTPGQGWLEQGKFDGPCLPHLREEAQCKKDFWVETKRA